MPEIRQKINSVKQYSFFSLVFFYLYLRFFELFASFSRVLMKKKSQFSFHGTSVKMHTSPLVIVLMLPNPRFFTLFTIASAVRVHVLSHSDVGDDR